MQHDENNPITASCTHSWYEMTTTVLIDGPWQAFCTTCAMHDTELGDCMRCSRQQKTVHMHAPKKRLWLQAPAETANPISDMHCTLALLEVVLGLIRDQSRQRIDPDDELNVHILVGRSLRMLLSLAFKLPVPLNQSRCYLHLHRRFVPLPMCPTLSKSTTLAAPLTIWRPALAAAPLTRHAARSCPAWLPPPGSRCMSLVPPPPGMSIKRC